MNINNIKNPKNVLNDNNNSDEKEKEKKDVNINKKDGDRIINKFEEPKVSLFENCFSEEPLGEIRITSFLFSNKYKEQIEAYRKIRNEESRKKIKQSFKCITPSGTFSQRKELFLVNHTKLICMDIDSKDNSDIDLDKAKHIIGQHCPSLYYAGLSLGGEGIFLLFRISNPELHKQHFDAFAYLLNKKFNLTVDTIPKNPVSLRVVSYDANPYYNPNPIPFKHIVNAKDRSAQVVRTVTDKNKTRENVERAIKFIYENRIDITNRYENWLKIGCALAYEFGEEGRYWFHVVSRMNEKFDYNDCDIQYNKCLKYKKDFGAKIATFFYYCKMYSVRY